MTDAAAPHPASEDLRSALVAGMRAIARLETDGLTRQHQLGMIDEMLAQPLDGVPWAMAETGIRAFLAALPSAADASAAPPAPSAAARALRHLDAFVERKAVMDTLGKPLTPDEWPRLVETLRTALVPAAGDGYDADACGICKVPLQDDDLCLTDVDLGTVHASCCGPERESYVNLTTLEPLAADEPIPAGWRWGDAKGTEDGQSGEAADHG